MKFQVGDTVEVAIPTSTFGGYKGRVVRAYDAHAHVRLDDYVPLCPGLNEDATYDFYNSELRLMERNGIVYSPSWKRS